MVISDKDELHTSTMFPPSPDDDYLYFPEYHVELPNAGRLCTPQVFEDLILNADLAHDVFLYTREETSKLGLDTGVLESSTTLNDNSFIYGVAGYQDYVDTQHTYASSGTFAASSLRNMELIRVNLLKYNGVRVRYGASTDEVEAKSGVYSDIGIYAGDAMKALKVMVKMYVKRLEASDVPVTNSNIFKLWALDVFSTQPLSCFDDKEVDETDPVIQERNIQLVAHNIKLTHAFTANSWYGNPDYAYSREFSYAPEDLVNFNDIPESYMNHIIWDEYKTYNKKTKRRV
jgi:hypothetical protein